MCGFELIEVSQDVLFKKVKHDPRRYRVGATNDMSSRMSDYKAKGLKPKTVYYAPSENPEQKENKLLNMLPADHPHNVQKVSNYPPGEGFVYAIDMK